MKFLRLLWRAAVIWNYRSAEVNAAALAYFALFALTPLLLLSITLVGLVIGGSEVTELLLRWGNSVDVQITELLRVSVQNFSTLTHVTFLTPLLATIFFSSVVIIALNSLSTGLSQINDVVRYGWVNFIKRSVRSIVFLFVLESYLVGIILLNRSFLYIAHVPVIHLVQMVYPIILYIGTLVLFMVGYGVLPMQAMSRRARFYGALVSSALFLCTRELVAIYTATSLTPGLFGAAGLIIVMLIWIYIAASVLFYGAAFAVAYDESRGRVPEATT